MYQTLWTSHLYVSIARINSLCTKPCGLPTCMWVSPELIHYVPNLVDIPLVCEYRLQQFIMYQTLWTSHLYVSIACINSLCTKPYGHPTCMWVSPTLIHYVPNLVDIPLWTEPAPHKMVKHAQTIRRQRLLTILCFPTILHSQWSWI